MRVVVGKAPDKPSLRHSFFQDIIPQDTVGIGIPVQLIDNFHAHASAVPGKQVHIFLDGRRFAGSFLAGGAAGVAAAGIPAGVIDMADTA